MPVARARGCARVAWSVTAVSLEENEIGRQIVRYPAPVLEPDDTGRQRGHPANRLLERDHPLLAHVAPEHPRERAVGGRMGRALPVVVGIRDEGHLRIGGKFAKPVLAADVEHELSDGSVLGQHQVRDGLEGLRSRRASEFGEGASERVAAGLAPHAGHPDPVPTHRRDQVVRPAFRFPGRPLGGSFLDVLSDPGPRLRVAQAGEQLARAALQSPRRIDGVHHGRRHRVGEHVRGDPHAFPAGLALHRRGRRRASPSGPGPPLPRGCGATRTSALRPISISSSTAGSSVSLDPRTWAVNTPSEARSEPASSSSSSVALNMPGG